MAYDHEYDEEEDWEEEWEEEDEWEDDEESLDWSEAWDEDGDGEVSAAEFSRTVSFGILAMMPLFLGYEWALSSGAAGPSPTRSIAEAILSTPLRPLGASNASIARMIMLGLIALYGLVGSFRSGTPLVPRLVRVLGEAALAALLLGPVLALTARAAEPFVGAMMIGEAAGVPELRRAAFVMGGAAYEEILFRVLAVALVFLLVKRGSEWMGFGRRLSSLTGALGATAVSAMLFAFFHTEMATRWMGGSGEPFDAALFTWRAASGVLLTAIVFWRGVGVAAWAHAFFNLVLLLGVRPPALF
ncbi:hypothetical protein Poly30_24090 [Planctomycetes bacterium Poly30]|uniref:CAAX prenyl protease 2/Lysostaphin resistance protein A-like domain-containing protein n=1 Tax=Saltatorellus ferox TaxID=2528018 RepID=A0A518ES44_9BACT|nr:hypothetical protein Poly30_24090 [Planctomycetes bacterium Poly30]